MIEWSEQHQMIRDLVRRFIDEEIVPNLEELEHGDLPPYEILRKMLKTFGMDEIARSRFKAQIEKAKATTGAGTTRPVPRSRAPSVPRPRKTRRPCSSSRSSSCAATVRAW